MRGLPGAGLNYRDRRRSCWPASRPAAVSLPASARRCSAALVLLATAATTIASQAVITGAFDDATGDPAGVCALRIQTGRGLWPDHVPAVNWLLMAATLTLAISFGSSHGLAAAYGIPVSADMLLTTFLLSIAVRDLGLAAAGGGRDRRRVRRRGGSFLSANLLKFTGGGWVPVLIAILLFTMMRIWQTGGAAAEQADEMQIRSAKSWPGSPAAGSARASTAVFLARLTRKFRRSWCGTSGTSDRCDRS